MPTIFTHAIVPLAVGLGLGSGRISGRLLAAGAVGAILPDLDVVAFKFGIAYADDFGHRGASHSLACALFVGLLAWLFAARLHASRPAAFLFTSAGVFSHGVLDTFTNGGHGVALWWPFSSERIFLPWQVVEVSPIGVARFFSERGLEVIQSELKWIWLPAFLVCGLLMLFRRTTSQRSARR